MSPAQFLIFSHRVSGIALPPVDARSIFFHCICWLAGGVKKKALSPPSTPLLDAALTLNHVWRWMTCAVGRRLLYCVLEAARGGKEVKG